MCWSTEASVVWATVGVSASAYLWYKKEPPVMWMTIGYFSLMEIIQALSYPVLNQCALPRNQMLTYLGYLHIAFQPFFVNLMALHFIPAEVRARIILPVMIACGIVTMSLVMNAYPFEWAGTCDPRRALCGPQMCTVSGNWHLAWLLPLNGLGNPLANFEIWGIRPFPHGMPGYAIVAFLMPALYGSWKFALYLLLSGPVLARFLTDNIHEQPAIWCLMAIAVSFAIVKTPLRRYLVATQVPPWMRWTLETPRSLQATSDLGRRRPAE